ncbi:hypothetical protein LIER_24809 [Lithospermum erythrorhizon]|uniref:Aminotransferase-like plant mobile domain-containing protein n=1 Tax=Lithospermum erythrorhizon TaxID=34254 RepID=A0AAV3R5J4_LITER
MVSKVLKRCTSRYQLHEVEDEDTFLAAHPPLHRGSFPHWEALSSKEAGSDMSWTPGESSRQSILAGRGHSRDEPPKIYRAEDVLSRYSAKLSTTSIYETVCASLFTYEYFDTLMKAFVECWSPSTNTLLLSHGEVSISLWDLYKLGGLPVAGYLMDEVVPSAECLSPSLGKSDHILESCCFLLRA